MRHRFRISYFSDYCGCGNRVLDHWVMVTDDKNTSLAEVKKWIQDFCEERGWDPYHGPKDLAIGAVTEASELLEIFRFVPERDLTAKLHDPKTRGDIADELSDNLFFILRFAQLYGFDLAQSLAQKLEKNARKYPKP